MKIFLASFSERHNWGPGRVIGVANGNRPAYIKCDVVFPPLIPSNTLMEKYYKEIELEPKQAAKNFTKSFIEQLEYFSDQVSEAAEHENKSTMEILPFSDGDTLATWERETFANYRSLIADCLEKLGFEVVRH